MTHKDKFMHQTLTESPFEKPLLLVKVTDPSFAARLRHMGIFEGMELIRIKEDVKLQPLRARCRSGDAVIGGGMSAKIVVHLDDGRKFPLAEMEPDETGHIEGLTGGTGLSSALSVLGFKNDERITLIRRLPPMEYVAFIEKKGRIRLTESMAAKIWGKIDKKMLQFNYARKGRQFNVKSILGGENAREMLRSRGIETGEVLVLEGVSPARTLYMSKKNPVVISTRDGLRLFLEQKNANKIFVKEK